MQHAITFDSVSKQYRLGAGQTSLREALTSRMRRLLPTASPSSTNGTMLWALRDVSFAVPQGHALGLIGPNGAGKTTILKVLSRITRPTSGGFGVMGRLSALIELGAGFHPDLTGRENIYLNAGIMGLSRRDVDRSLGRIVDFSGLADFIDTPVKRYSSGMYVRLGFSVAAHVEPDVLLVDEVLAVGDAHFRQRCAKRIQELQALGTTIVFVGHNLYLVRSVCDTALFMLNGRIQSEGNVDSVIAAYESWLYATQETEAATRLDQHNPQVSETSVAEIDAIDLVGLEGGPVTDLTHDQGLVVRVHFSAREPIHNPNLVLRLIRADGVTCAMIRTGDHGIRLEDLAGSGAISVAIDPLQLSGGAYSFEARLMGALDGIPLTQAHSSWFHVTGPSLSHQEQSGVFVPRVVWTRLRPDNGSGVAVQPTSSEKLQ